METDYNAEAAGGGGGGLSVGRPVQVPDGRSGVIRFTYSGKTGPTVVVRTDEGSMLVLPAARCRTLPQRDMTSSGGGI